MYLPTLSPSLTGVFSYFIIGEELNNQKILGIVIVVAGLFFSQLKKSLRCSKLNNRNTFTDYCSLNLEIIFENYSRTSLNWLPVAGNFTVILSR